jgi:hypothetical protein
MTEVRESYQAAMAGNVPSAGLAARRYVSPDGRRYNFQTG